MAYKRTSPISVAEGGTNAITLTTPDGVVYFDGTSLVTTAVGSATDVLTSNGPGMAPTFQAGGGGGGTNNFVTDAGTATQSGGSITFVGDGTVTTSGTGSTVTIAATANPAFTGTTSSSTGFEALGGNVKIDTGNLVLPRPNGTDFTKGYVFQATSPLMGFLDNNVFIGLNSPAPIAAAFDYNIGINNQYVALNNALNNIAIGQDCGTDFRDGNYNIALGIQCLENNFDGSYNIGIGYLALEELNGGNYSIAIGYNAGINYVSSESSNIVLANNGIVGESNVIRIGTQGTGAGQQNACYIAGIYGTTTSSMTTSAVLVDTNGNLGTVVSSRRFKDDIEDMAEASQDIMNLRPVTFTYKKDPTHTLQWGLIAEEVEEVFPDLVNYDDEGDPFTVKYQDLPVMLLNELQKLSQRLDENEKIIRDLKEGNKVCRCSKSIK